MKDDEVRVLQGQMDLLPPEGIDWSRLVFTRRVWLEDVGGDQGARLEFLADQGLRLLMVDVDRNIGETLHFSHPSADETLHLRPGGGGSLLREAEKYFPSASRWIELLQGEQEADQRERPSRPAAAFLHRAGLIVEIEGGFILRVNEAYRDFPQGILCGAKTGQVPALLESEGGTEGIALSLAFAQALEDARGMRLPAAAVALRAVILESARAQSHLAWIGAAASALRKQRIAALCAGLRRYLGEVMEKWLGESSGRGWVVPGGIKEEFPLESAADCGMELAAVAAAWEKSSSRVISLPLPRWAEKKLRPLLGEGERNAWVGPLARAAGRGADVRKEEPGIYRLVEWESAAAPEGAGILRRMLAIRAGEVASSLQVMRRIVAELPDTPLLVKRGRGGRGEGFGRCEGPDGEVCCHVALEKGRVSFITFSLPHELNRSAARVMEGCRLDEADILSLLWRY